MRIILFLLLMLVGHTSLPAQVLIKGTVYDVSKINPVENVKVYTNDSLVAISDSLGRYHIFLQAKDSFYFEFRNKPTQKFGLKQVSARAPFDISLGVSVPSKYNALKEVIVYSKSYRQDSLENRNAYADIFEYQKPGFSTSMGPGGTVGADVNELINIFRFKRNKRLKKFQQRLEYQEQERYIDFRFNSLSIKRTTGLEPPLLDTFMRWYRPSYEFAAAASEVQLVQYILLAFDQFKKIQRISASKPKKIAE